MALTLDGTAGITFPVTAGSASAVQASSGRVLQVVQSTSSSTIATTSTPLTASGLITSITPSSSTSKILVMLSGGATTYDASGTLVIAIYRQIASAGYSLLTNAQSIFMGSGGYGWGTSFNYLDSPATTSIVYYQPYIRSSSGNNLYLNYSGASGVITLTLMEIAA
jgi:hypothetical protein